MRIPVILVLTFSLHALAEEPSLSEFPPPQLTKKDCPAYDFSPKMGPVRYQGSGFVLGTNMCHAFTAADLITVNQGLKPKNRISALDVANAATVYKPDEILKPLPENDDATELKQREDDRRLLENLQAEISDKPSYMWPGYPHVDVEAYNLRPYACTEAAFPSEASIKDPGRSTFAEDKVRSALKKAKAKIKNWNQWNPCLSENTLQSLQDVKAAAELQLRREMDSEMRKVCDRSFRLKPMTSRHAVIKLGDAAKKTLELFKQGIPVGIGYDSISLHARSLSRDPGHASTVAGSRWNEKTKTCEFKIRNSTGPDCPTRGPWECQEGNYWIPEWQYNQMAVEMFYIDAQK